MSKRKYREEFKTEVIKQVVERGYGVREVCKRLGISSKACTCGCGERGRALAEVCRATIKS